MGQPTQSVRSALRTRNRPNPSPGMSRAPIRPRSSPRKAPDRPGTDLEGVFVARYQAEQAAIGHLVTNVLRNLWDQHIDPAHFSDSWQNVAPLMKLVVTRHYMASAASGARFYRRLSSSSGMGIVRVVPHQIDTARLDRVAGSVANGTFYHQLNTRGREPLDASLIARNTVSGAGSRFALNGARNTVMAAVTSDPHAMGWERVTGPTACSFCTSHAVRGPFKPGVIDFHPHDYCNCVARPLFRGQEPVNAALSAEWASVTRGAGGKTARVMWEQYKEGGDHGGNQDPRAGDSSGPGETGQAGQGSAV